MKKIKLLIAAIFLCTSVFLSGCSQKERIASSTSETTSIENSDNVHVKYINAYTGEVISDTNSKDIVE